MAPGAGPQVKFQSEYVLNLWDTWEKIDIRPKSCIYEVTSQLADDSSCTLEAECVVAIPAHEDSVLRAAATLGVERASSQDAVRETFHYPLVESIQTALAKCTPEYLSTDRESFCDVLVELTSFYLRDRGFEIQSVEIRKVRLHKKAGEPWTP